MITNFHIMIMMIMTIMIQEMTSTATTASKSRKSRCVHYLVISLSWFHDLGLNICNDDKCQVAFAGWLNRLLKDDQVFFVAIALMKICFEYHHDDSGWNEQRKYCYYHAFWNDFEWSCQQWKQWKLGYVMHALFHFVINNWWKSGYDE